MERSKVNLFCNLTNYANLAVWCNANGSPELYDGGKMERFPHDCFMFGKIDRRFAGKVNKTKGDVYLTGFITSTLWNTQMTWWWCLNLNDTFSQPNSSIVWPTKWAQTDRLQPFLYHSSFPHRDETKNTSVTNVRALQIRPIKESEFHMHTRFRRGFPAR